MGKQGIGKPQKSKKHKKLKKTIGNEDTVDPTFVSSKRGKQQNLPVPDGELDVQHVPRKLKDMLHAKHAMSETKLKKKKTLKKKRKRGKLSDELLKEGATSRPMARIPRFEQGKFEKDGDFIRRVEMETHRVIMRSKMENKYKVDLMEDQNNITNLKMKKRPTSENKKQRSRDKKQKKKEAKQEKKIDKQIGFSGLTDRVSFGEVAMEPPTLTARPRKANSDNEKPRPGKRSLLLKEMMGGPSSSKDPEPSSQPHLAVPKTSSQRQPGQTLKRKFLSPVQQQITDYQRQNAISMYRQIRDQKYQRNNLKT
ncbi:CC137-like protein [Mya arenaria]|uniref:CC137-like protein n=1 Tax=Mya arenaria TaxID=6604 RepID=A0ABY7DN79_MYAAR|nr:coiled-coil domain-containing protein 137-like [Mya arenaria]WAQ96455.1 CC137-like protein [Mya arenaria]